MLKYFEKPTLLLVIILSIGQTLWAEENRISGTESSSIRILTLDDAQIMAAEQNKDIKKAHEYRKMVEGRYVEERAAALPQLTFIGNIGISRDETQPGFPPIDGTMYGGKISLTQPLYTWGKIGAALRAAEIGLKTADDQFNRYRQSVIRDVSASFYDLLLAKEIETINRQNFEQRTRHLDESQRKYAAGMATEYDILAADVAAKNAWPEVIHSTNLVEISRERLGILLGLKKSDFEIQGNLETEPSPLPDFDQTLDTALKNRPELAELNHRLGIQKELVAIAKAGDKPRVDLQASYGWQDVRANSIEVNGQAASGAIVLSFPFFDGFRTGGLVSQAESEVKSMILEDAKLRDSILLQVAESINALKESAEILKALAGTVTLAERLLDMAEKGFVYGVKTNLDVQDALLNLKQARANLAKAKRDYLVAKVTCQWVMGTICLPSSESAR